MKSQLIVSLVFAIFFFFFNKEWVYKDFQLISADQGVFVSCIAREMIVSKTSVQLVIFVSSCGLYNWAHWYIFVYIMWHMVLVSSGHRSVLKICGSTRPHNVVFVIEKLDFFSGKQLRTKPVDRSFEWKHLDFSLYCKIVSCKKI